jgi:hypothetical protein
MAKNIIQLDRINMPYIRSLKASRQGHFLDIRLNAPYCFKRLRSGKWLPLNREYRPLGISRSQSPLASYEEYESEALPSGALHFDRIPASRGDTEERKFLYGDATAPHRSLEHHARYCARLEAIMARS